MMIRTCIAGAAAVALSLLAAMATGTPAEAASKPGKCVRAGGEANMVTQDLATFMAKAALKNSIEGMGAKPVGPIKLACKVNGLLQYCKATQRACK